MALERLDLVCRIHGLRCCVRSSCVRSTGMCVPGCCRYSGASGAGHRLGRCLPDSRGVLGTDTAVVQDFGCGGVRAQMTWWKGAGVRQYGFSKKRSKSTGSWRSCSPSAWARPGQAGSLSILQVLSVTEHFPFLGAGTLRSFLCVRKENTQWNSMSPCGAAFVCLAPPSDSGRLSSCAVMSLCSGVSPRGGPRRGALPRVWPAVSVCRWPVPVWSRPVHSRWG